VVRTFTSPCFGLAISDVRSFNWETDLWSCNN